MLYAKASTIFRNERFMLKINWVGEHMYLGLFLWYTNRLEDMLYKFFKKNPTIFLNFQISSQPRVFMKFSNWFNVSLIWSLSWPSGRLSFCSSCNNSMAWTKISLGSYKVFLKNILKLACTYLICLLRPWSSMPVMEKIFFLSSWACYSVPCKTRVSYAL